MRKWNISTLQPAPSMNQDLENITTGTYEEAKELAIASWRKTSRRTCLRSDHNNGADYWWYTIDRDGIWRDRNTIGGVEQTGKHDKIPSQIWNEIKGKAHMYQTAKLGEIWVKILGVVTEGTFNIRHPELGEMHAGCHELTNYGL